MDQWLGKAGGVGDGKYGTLQKSLLSFVKVCTHFTNAHLYITSQHKYKCMHKSILQDDLLQKQVIVHEFMNCFVT